MAVQKITGGDLYSDLVSKFNNNADEIPVSGAMVSNGVLRITLEGGGTFDINIPPSSNQVISGCSFIVDSSGQVTISAGTYLIGGTLYTIASPVVFNLDAPDTNPRIDVIVVNTSSTGTFVKGTPDTNPSEPSITSTQLKLGIVFVDESGYGEETLFIPQGLSENVVVSSETNQPATYNSGTQELTSLTSGAFVLHGVTLQVGDRVLIRAQSDSRHNGIYDVTDKGSAFTQWVCKRASDFNGAGGIRKFLAVLTSKNDIVNGGKLYGLDGDHSSLTLDTDNMDFFHIPTPFKDTTGGGGGGRSFATKTSITILNSPYTMTAGERVEVDCSGGNVVVNPPQINNQVYSIVKTDSSINTIQVAPPSGTILGDIDLVMESQWDSVELISNGTNMTII